MSFAVDGQTITAKLAASARFSGQDMDVIERQPDGREITIERA